MADSVVTSPPTTSPPTAAPTEITHTQVADHVQVEWHETRLGKLVHRGMLRDLLIVACLIFADMEWSKIGIGGVVFLLGCGLHFWSKACLMRNFMVTRHGPYRMVRHPFYLANLIIDIGIILMAGNMYLFLGYLPLFLLSYIPTIRQEERDLTAAHGDVYREYVRQRPMLISLRIDRLLGPLDASWTNILRENELTRLGRVLAVPFILLMIDGLWHKRLLSGSPALILGVTALTVAVVIHVLAVQAKSWSRRQLVGNVRDLSDIFE